MSGDRASVAVDIPSYRSGKAKIVQCIASLEKEAEKEICQQLLDKFFRRLEFLIKDLFLYPLKYL